jgi:GDP-L-fucose synthase
LGTGVDHSILKLPNLVKVTVGFEGEITHDLTKPDGMPVKRLDVSLANSLGWKPKSLENGISSAYEDFLSGLESGSTRL